MRASLLISSGCSPRAVAAFLGHKNAAESAGGDCERSSLDSVFWDDGMDRNEMPEALIRQWRNGVVNTEQLRYLLGDAWTMPEFPLSAAPMNVWLEMFRAPGFVSDCRHEGPPNAPVQLYRGAMVGWERAMSWTTDFDRALWFVQRNVDAWLPATVVGVVARLNRCSPGSFTGVKRTSTS